MLNVHPHKLKLNPNQPQKPSMNIQGMEFSLLFQCSSVTIVLGVLLAFFLLPRVSTWRFKPAKTIRLAKNPLPPEAGGSWPIIGHLGLLGGPEPAHITLGALADVHGPAFTIRLGQYRALVVSSWELAKELFTTNDMAALSRPNLTLGKYLYDNAMFGFSPYGAYWREMRKISAVELLSAGRIELLKHVRISEIEISTKELYKLWSDYQNRNISSSGGPVLVEMKHWFGDLTLNVILRMIVGKRYFGSVGASEEKEARNCQEVTREFFYFIGVFLVADFIPMLRWLDIGGYQKKMKIVAKEMDQIVDGWLKEHRRKKESGEEIRADHHQDFMDVMLSVLDGADIAAGYDADTITKATCMNLIIGGSDTTVVMLTWAVSLLINNPSAMKNAQEELDMHVGKERRVNESDITNLVYLQAIIKETLRLYPAAPLGGPREFTEDCSIGGYHIPKGTRLIPNLWKLHRDPNVWPNPLEFRPERFLTTHKDIDVKGHHFELIPFGTGRRICPGINFGLQMLHFVLANFLHAFDLSNPSDEPIDMAESVGLTAHKATPLQLLVAPRLPHNLY